MKRKTAYSEQSAETCRQNDDPDSCRRQVPKIKMTTFEEVPEERADKMQKMIAVINKLEIP